MLLRLHWSESFQLRFSAAPLCSSCWPLSGLNEVRVSKSYFLVQIRCEQRHRAEHEVGARQRGHRLAQGEAGVLLGVVEAQHRIEVFRRVVAQLAAHGLGVLVVVLVPGGRIGDVAVGLGQAAGNRGRPCAAQRTAEIELALAPAEVAEAGFDRARGALAGIPGYHLDRPAGGVLAVQRALRAAQHFHALDVEQADQPALDARVVDVIDIHAHARVEGLQCVRLANAADEDVHRRGRAAALHDVHVRHRALQAVDAVRLQVLHVIAAERGDRHRHLFQRLVAAPRTDRHFLQFLDFSFLRCRRLGTGTLARLLRVQRRDDCQAQNQTDRRTQMRAFHDVPLQ